MKTRESTVPFPVSIPPANIFSLLSAAYGSKTAESIFKSHGLNRPVNPLHVRARRRADLPIAC